MGLRESKSSSWDAVKPEVWLSTLTQFLCHPINNFHFLHHSLLSSQSSVLLQQLQCHVLENRLATAKLGMLMDRAAASTETAATPAVAVLAASRPPDRHPGRLHRASASPAVGVSHPCTPPLSPQLPSWGAAAPSRGSTAAPPQTVSSRFLQHVLMEIKLQLLIISVENKKMFLVHHSVKYLKKILYFPFKSTGLDGDSNLQVRTEKGIEKKACSSSQLSSSGDDARFVRFHPYAFK